MLKDSCNEEGVDTDFRDDEKLSTGRCGVIITGYGRSLCTSLGAANAYTLEHLRTPSVWEKVQRTKIFYVEGYHLTACVPAALALAEEALERKKVSQYWALCKFQIIDVAVRRSSSASLPRLSLQALKMLLRYY